MGLGLAPRCYGASTLSAKLLAAVFFQFHLEERWRVDKCKLGVISQELLNLKIEVKLLLSVSRKSCMPRRLAYNNR